MNLDKSINSLSQRLNKIYPDSSKGTHNDGMNYWKGKKIIPADQWLEFKKQYGKKAALEFFPGDFLPYSFPLQIQGEEDQQLKQAADSWYSDYTELMEFRKNPTYGKRKCFHCLLSPDRIDPIFIGINSLVARGLQQKQPEGEGVMYPCKVVNWFECPYSKDKVSNENIDIDELFKLAEMAFATELALTKAMEANSLIKVRTVDDIYHVLTNKEILEKILEQGLDEEKHKQYKDQIIELFMSIRDKIAKMEELSIGA